MIKNPKENRETFMARLSHLSKHSLELIEYAYDLAKESHRPQVRDGGGRYFEHPRAVALILIDELGIIDVAMIVTALNHDAGEDSATFGNRTKGFSVFKEKAFFRLRRTFDERSAKMIIDLTKPVVDGNEIKTKEEADELYFNNLRASTGGTLLIKMADRLHNLRTVATTTHEKIKKTIDETEAKYYPLFDEMSKKPGYQKERAVLYGKIKQEIEILKVYLFDLKFSPAY